MLDTIYRCRKHVIRFRSKHISTRMLSFVCRCDITILKNMCNVHKNQIKCNINICNGDDKLMIRKYLYRSVQNTANGVIDDKVQFQAYENNEYWDYRKRTIHLFLRNSKIASIDELSYYISALIFMLFKTFSSGTFRCWRYIGKQ